jgi:hypothetical protein
VGIIIEDMYTVPLMVAYSGLVNKDVEKMAKEAGFDLIIESPLTVEKITEIVLRGIEDKISLKNDLQNKVSSKPKRIVDELD